MERWMIRYLGVKLKGSGAEANLPSRLDRRPSRRLAMIRYSIYLDRRREEVCQ
jgi:hypothetical protein